MSFCHMSHIPAFTKFGWASVLFWSCWGRQQTDVLKEILIFFSWFCSNSPVMEVKFNEIVEKAKKFLAEALQKVDTFIKDTEDTIKGQACFLQGGSVWVEDFEYCSPSLPSSQLSSSRRYHRFDHQDHYHNHHHHHRSRCCRRRRRRRHHHLPPPPPPPPHHHHHHHHPTCACH